MSGRGVPRRSRLFPDRSRTTWQPGIVEVRFSPDVKPEVVSAGASGGAPIVRDLGTFDLSKFQKLATKWHVRDIRPMAVVNLPKSAGEGTAVSSWSKRMFGNYVVLCFDRNAPVEQIAREFAALPEVASASPSPIFSRATLPNDSFLGTSDQVQPQGLNLENQWYIFHSHANDAWELTGPGGARINGHGVTVAIVDEAFDANHEDLQGHVTQRFNVITNDTSLTPPNGNNQSNATHGTAVAGLAGAIGDNNQGICGFAWGSDLWLVQTKGTPDQAGPQNPMFQALSWVGHQTVAQGNARTVVNISMGQDNPGMTAQSPIDAKITGNGPPNTTIQTAINALIDSVDTRAVVCIAAGNDEKGQTGKDVSTDSQGNPDPGGGSKAIVVGAMYVNGGDNVRYPSSNWGSRVTVCAPGDYQHDMTCSTGVDGPYRKQFGQTSGATPKVAGTAALMLQANPNLTHEQVKAILNGTGTELTPSRFEFAKPIGPMLNTVAAVQAAVATTSGPKLVCNRFLNFGSVEQGSTSTLKVSVFNIGSQPLQLTSFEKAAGGSDRFSLASAFASSTIDRGATDPVDIVIQFAPNSRHDVRATFNLVTNDPTSPTVPVVCTGTAPWKLSPWGKIAIVAGGVVLAVLIYKLLQYFNVIKSS